MHFRLCLFIALFLGVAPQTYTVKISDVGDRQTGLTCTIENKPKLTLFLRSGTQTHG